MITNTKSSNGFEYIEIENNSATAKIALQGAHLFHYQKHDTQPLLWLSPKSHFETGKAIRGGIPICWPWFGKHNDDASLPQHGFARTSLFTLLESNEPDEDTTELFLQLQSSAETLALWPYEFEVLVRIIIGPALTVALSTKNVDSRPFTITSALHSYFSVSHINKVSVQGLDKTEYWDSLTDENNIQHGDIHIREEVDRVYQKVKNDLILHDQNRTIHITTKGSSSAVVWNPWSNKSKRMTDMQDDAYETMLCIETANALADAQNLVPGEEHTLQCSFNS
jgi:glucose-6-phosphate 1-epimerase